MPVTPYTDFDLQPIAGKWRHGSSATSFNNTNPYSGESLVQGPRATVEDLDAAYTGAQEAQRDWARCSPTERSAIFLRAADVIDTHTGELVDWLVMEAGATRMRALVELGIVRAATMAAVTHTALGVKTVPSDVPGKENRVYTRPAGVVAVISPWNFPMYLSNRSVAPALALGNAVVLKPADDTPVTGGLLIAKILEQAGLLPAC